jgi:PAS domain S-box-containing protein
LRASGESYEKNQAAAFRLNSPSQSWLGAVGLFVVVGIAYFLAARVGLVLGVSQGVPIFWPAAGIAVGAFITLGPNARLPVAVAVVAATIASGILIGRSLSLTITFAFFNTGEALLTAWLIECWFGRAFTLETVRQVLGFVVASAVSEAIAASGAGIVVHFLEPTTSSGHAWRLWFASCSLGIFTVAPLLIGLGEIVRELPPRRELIEGTVGLATLAALSVFVISLPQSPWATALPVALVLPVILWIAVRCRPAFAAAAMFLVALAVFWSTTFDVGHFADASVPHSDRILAAQTLVLAAALLALVLAALFAERRRTEAALKQGSERLRLALDGAELGAFSADLAIGRFECDARAAQIHGHKVRPENLKEVRRFVHPDDLARIDASLAEAQRTGGIWNAEYRVVPPPDHPHAGETRWVAVESSIMRDLQGAPVGLLGVTRDITERKHTEQTLAERNAQLDLAGRAALVGSYAYDLNTRVLQFSEGYAAIYDLPEGTSEMTGSQRRALVHPEDLEQLDRVRSEAFEQRRREFSLVYRNILPKRGVRWIESRSLILYDSNGRPERTVGVNIDVTEHKQMEQALADRNRQLELAGKVALVASFAIEIDLAREDFASNRMQVTPGFSAIYGLPEETVEISVGDWRSLVHPEDLPQFLERRQQVFAQLRSEHHAEFRIVRPCGTTRWIETRSYIEYDQAGYAKRMVGVNIDMTERRLAEEARKILNAELDHRVKNALATVTAVISQTRRRNGSVADFAVALDGRIRSMATTHELLSSHQWHGVSLMELVRRELAPYATRNNTEINGPPVLLKPEAGRAIAMVLHELTINAAKYGALSSKNGRVAIRWDQYLNGHPRSHLVFEWQEIGGPPVIAVGEPSYGTSTIRDLVPYEFGGTVDLVLARDGVRCRLELPSDWLGNDREAFSETGTDASPPIVEA